MKSVRLLGPMVERSYVRGGRRITFEKGTAVEIDDDFADELLASNPEKFSLEEAARYGTPVFELVEDDAPAPPES